MRKLKVRYRRKKRLRKHLCRGAKQPNDYDKQ